MVKFDQLDLYHVRLPLLSAWTSALGSESVVESVLVRAQSGETVVWSETTPHPTPIYGSERALGVFVCLRDHLCPRLVGREFATAEELALALLAFPANPHAKAAIDFAWWTMAAALEGLPLHRKLGASRDQVEVGESFGVQKSLDELVRLVGEAEDRGFTRVKLKFCPGWDVEMLQAVRRDFPELTLHIDCNGSYTLDDLELFKKIDSLGLAAIEQPLAEDDLLSSARLAEQLQTPIGLDEGVVSLERVREAVRLKACRFLFIKPARVGGLTEALKIAIFAKAHGLSCSVGSGLESAIGGALNLALATADGFNYPASVFASKRFYENDLAEPEMTLQKIGDKQVATALPSPGTGRAPHPQRLKDWTLRAASVGPFSEK